MSEDKEKSFKLDIIFLLVIILLLVIIVCGYCYVINNIIPPESNQKGDKIYRKGNKIVSIVDNTFYSSFDLKTKEVPFWYCKKICEVITKVVSRNPSKKYNILLLGVDLGGILINLTNKLNNVFITGVDISDIYFNVVEEFAQPNTFKLVKTDAEQFMKKQKKDTFDYIICDIFLNGTNIPDFVFSNDFLENINKSLHYNGKFLINTIDIDHLKIKNKFEKIFINSEIRFETEYPSNYTLNLVTIVSKNIYKF
jgi:lipopolysaccharide export LptBFGC system permease protein LptF